MEKSFHRFSELFSQLGLRMDAAGIGEFLEAHAPLPADVLLPFFGLASNLGPIAEWGLGMDRNLIVIDPATCMTSMPGIFAIGDIVSYPGKLKLILQGFSEAAMAAHAAFAFVHPGQALHFEHSTTTGLPGASS